MNFPVEQVYYLTQHSFKLVEIDEVFDVTVYLYIDELSGKFIVHFIPVESPEFYNYAPFGLEQAKVCFPQYHFTNENYLESL